MKDDECCGVTEDTCDERRETCKESRVARDEVLMRAMENRDARIDKRIEKLETRFDQILLAILVQLAAFFIMYVGTKM
jgi:hypothetical protein